MASPKEKMVAEMFEKLVVKDSKDDSYTLDHIEKKTEVYNEVVHENNQQNNKDENDPVELSKSPNINFDDKPFVSSEFEEGESSKQDEGA